MRGWLPLLALGACLAAFTLPAMAGDTRPGTWVEIYNPASNGPALRWQSADDEEQSLPADGSTTALPAPSPSVPTVEATPLGVTVIRGAQTNPLTADESADGVTIVRGPGLHH
jgi:hypothetical protein